MTLRVFEAFSGVGSQRMALRNIGANFEVVATSDWNFNSVLAYNAIHTENPKDFTINKTMEEIESYLYKINISADGKEPLTLKQIQRYNDKKKKDIYNAFMNTNNLGSIVGINPEEVPDCDLFTYSYPCTSISLSGSQKGMAKGSGTPSSMIWECQKIIEAKKPKYLLMENVKNLVGKKFKPFFDEWLEYLEQQGYKSFWKVLNAKDYGVSQNRERTYCISILDCPEDVEYKFPDPIPLTKCLEDYLETDVDEKYFLSDDKMERLIYNMEHKDGK